VRLIGRRISGRLCGSDAHIVTRHRAHHFIVKWIEHDQLETVTSILHTDNAAWLPHSLAALVYYFNFSVERFYRYQVSRPLV
jgi:hypothetical protein